MFVVRGVGVSGRTMFIRTIVGLRVRILILEVIMKNHKVGEPPYR